MMQLGSAVSTLMMSTSAGGTFKTSGKSISTFYSAENCADIFAIKMLEKWESSAEKVLK
jgi:NAD dependent epimerase/dehydratase family enzyme